MPSFLEQHPGLAEALDQGAVTNPIVQDIAERFRVHGYLTPKQVALVMSLAKPHAAAPYGVWPSAPRDDRSRSPRRYVDSLGHDARGAQRRRAGHYRYHHCRPQTWT